jgi:hypothetical protein
VEHRDVLVALLNEILGARSAEEWLKRLEAAGVPAGRIKTVAEVCESDHLKARDMIVTLPHPSAGTVTMMGVPVKLHATPGAARTAPPRLGQHTDAILEKIAGVKRAPTGSHCAEYRLARREVTHAGTLRRCRRWLAASLALCLNETEREGVSGDGGWNHHLYKRRLRALPQSGRVSIAQGRGFHGAERRA